MLAVPGRGSAPQHGQAADPVVTLFTMYAYSVARSASSRTTELLISVEVKKKKLKKIHELKSSTTINCLLTIYVAKSRWIGIDLFQIDSIYICTCTGCFIK